MNPIWLYGVTVIVWGSSWLAVKHQVGVVAPEASLVYRFALAALVMMVLCVLRRERMRFELADHARMATIGLLLFCANFFFIYSGMETLTSGLASVAFSTVVGMNILIGAALFGEPIRPRVAAGAALGMAGIAVVFWPEVRAFDVESGTLRGLGLVLLGTASASLGMLSSARAQRRGLPVFQANAYGMVYGTLFLLALCLARGTPFDFDPRPAYVISLAYVTVFASVIGFWSYLTLVGRIGADRAAYASVLFPVVALALSTAFEGFVWSIHHVIGVAVVLAGNVLVLTRGRAKPPIAAEIPTPETAIGKAT